MILYLYYQNSFIINKETSFSKKIKEIKEIKEIKVVDYIKSF